MLARNMTRLVATTVAITALIVTGCDSGGKATVVRSVWPTDSADPQTTNPSSFAFMGDEPAYDAVPFQNHLISNIAQHTFTVDGLDFDPDVDPTGTELVFASTRHAPRPDIYVKNVEGTAMTQLTDDKADDIQPRFSPDGQQIAFCSNRGSNWDIWVINRDGTNLRQMTAEPGDEIAPCWSPDGKQLAYSVWTAKARRWELWTLYAEQPGVQRFLAYGMFPSWSPDGTHLAFQRARQRGTRWFSIWTVQLVDGEARFPTEVAYRPAAACIGPRWSPDGGMLIYCAISGQPSEEPTGPTLAANADIWALDLANDARFKVTNGDYAAFNPAWGPYGRVFFVSTRKGTENIWSIVATPETLLARRGLDAEPRVTRVPVPGPGE